MSADYQTKYRYGIITGLGSHGQVKMSSITGPADYETRADAENAMDIIRRTENKLCCVYRTHIADDGIPVIDPNSWAW